MKVVVEMAKNDAKTSMSQKSGFRFGHFLDLFPSHVTTSFAQLCIMFIQL